MSKLKVAVLFGGRTVEHDVSIITGNEVMTNLNKEKYDIIPIYISREGVWYTGKELIDLRLFKQIENIIPSLQKVFIAPMPAGKALMAYHEKWGRFKNPIFDNVDVVIPALHGLNGEDGSIQGLMELANIPYVGSGVLGSAVGMDKVLMKSVFKGHELPILKYTWFIRKDWDNNKKAVLDKVEVALNYPMFIKPANLGSSIGISKAKSREELEAAIEIAVRYDRRIIVEEGLNNLIEINCSVVGIDDDVKPSECEQPVTWEEFLSYEDKYLRWSGGSKGVKGGKMVGVKGMGASEGATTKIPADLPDDLTKQIKSLAVEAFKSLDCKGVARIDFLIDKNEMKPYLNEINTIPGSFSFYLWEPSGLKFIDLLDKLIDIAIKNNEEKNKNIYTFDNDLIEKIGSALEKKDK